MTRIEHTKCPTCAHYRLGQFGPTPTCALAQNPPNKFCCHAWDDGCEGKYWEARK